MARLALLSDIHGNLPALEAVLEDLSRQDLDEILLVGDLVGRGPQGSAVVQRVRSLGWRSVRGNHEDYLLEYRRGRVPESWATAKEWSALRWMSAELSEEDICWLEQLPFTLTSHIAPEVRLFHGTYQSSRHGIGYWTSEGRLQQYLDFQDEPVLVCGHTHRPFVHRDGGRLIVNVGSVGLPFNGDTRAQYAVLDNQSGQWEVEFRQVEYSLEEIFDIYRESGFLEEGFTTSRLLMVELRHARPFLVPYLYWLDKQEIGHHEDRVHEFLEWYDPDKEERKMVEKFRQKRQKRAETS
jgi:putative phosphoesterase